MDTHRGKEVIEEEFGNRQLPLTVASRLSALRDLSRDFFSHPVISAFPETRYFLKLHILDHHPAGVAPRRSLSDRSFKPLN